MRIAVTGHRPAKLPGRFDEAQHGEIKEWLKREVARAYKLDPDLEAASGMSIGSDIYFVEACVEQQVPFMAFIPFTGQEERWPRTMQVRYRKLLERSMEIVEATPVYSKAAFFRRNDMILDWLEGDPDNLLLVVWDGVNEGGTYYTFSSAKERGIGIKFLSVGRER